MVTTCRLRSSGDIRMVVSGRCAAGAEHVVVHARMSDPDAPARIAVVAGRRVGSAVRRNRAKRRIRAVLHEVGVAPGVDLVVSAKSGADTVMYTRLTDEIQESVRRARKRAGTQAVVAT